MSSRTNPSQSRPNRRWRSPGFLWIRRQRSNWVKTSLVLGIITAIVAVAMPAQALLARLSPTSPQLGDTISVAIEQNSTLNSSPTVKMGGKTYSAFVTSSGRFRALLPTTPLDKPGPVQIQVSAGGEVKNLTVSLRDRAFPVQRIRLTGAAGAEATQLELDRVAAFKKLETPEKYWKGAFVRPNGAQVSTGYGIRRYYNGVFAKDYYHGGVDYAGGMGSPVVSPAAGRIALVGRVSEGFRVHGNC
ncbi:MAG TPA: M23 family peptidase, partial [Allocoleopsis sp.]